MEGRMEAKKARGGKKKKTTKIKEIGGKNKGKKEIGRKKKEINNERNK